jgi:hypothetical protein
MSISDPQSFNRYTYVQNDPVNLTDTLGLMAGAEQGYGGFQGWGGASGLNGSNFGGPGILYRAMLRHDYAVSNGRYGGHYSDPTPYDDYAGDGRNAPSGSSVASSNGVSVGGVNL